MSATVHQLRDWFILLIVTGMIGCVAPRPAQLYYVLVIERADQSDTAAIEQFQRSAERLNNLHLEGFPEVRPYFNVLKLSDGQAYFVFGYRGEVQGLVRKDFPNVQQNLRNHDFGGKLGYPDPYWVPVDSIRRRLVEDMQSSNPKGKGAVPRRVTAMEELSSASLRNWNVGMLE